MCGIAGIVNLSPAAAPVSAAELRKMTAALTHRGPDDEGVWVDPQGRAGLAFRRLSIIDLAGGHQPLSNEDGSLWLAFNGEIYNFRDVRDQLAAAGHRFATHSDSEVIVHAFEEWGTDCFSRLAGMFAVALWDVRAGTLTLARDRLGKKPLTYAIQNGRLYFASEAKAILALGVSREIDLGALGEYLVLQYVRAPLSIFKTFAKIAPGCLAQVTPTQNAQLHTQRYWSLPASQRFRGGYSEAKARLGTLLRDAVRKRLVADVPLGAFLSGGIDSSIVVALMAELGVSPLRTFSIGFEDRRYDETRYARLVAKRFNTEHHEQIVTPDARGILDTLAHHYDEPFGDSSAIPTYYVSQSTRRSVTVALTGDGGDEGFCGYDRYRAARLAQRLDRVPHFLQSAAALLAGRLPAGSPKSATRRAYRFLSVLAAPAAERYRNWVQIFSPELLGAGFAERIAPLCLAGSNAAARFIDELMSPASADLSPSCPADERAARTDVESYLPFDLLTKVDIASMACSLECRAPLLDHQLLEFAFSLPAEWKSRGGGKHILRDWAAPLLPAEVLNRRKMGFGVPVGEWFRGPLRDELHAALFSADSVAARIFRSEWLRKLADEHKSGRDNHEHRLWLLLMLDRWYRRWNPTGI